MIFQDLIKMKYKNLNILDYVKLSKILDDSYKLIAIDSLSESDLQSLFNKIDVITVSSFNLK